MVYHALAVMTNDSMVRFPKELKEAFERLPKRWLNFADFCREAVRLYLKEQEMFALDLLVKLKNEEE